MPAAALSSRARMVELELTPAWCMVATGVKGNDAVDWGTAPHKRSSSCCAKPKESTSTL